MELRQLRYFTTIAETLNFHRAAERLNVSQPPLTVAIRKLEEELGAPLFVREARGVSLTAAGEAALPFARSALVQADLVRQATREGSEGERGRLLIGFIGSAVFALLPMIIPEFRSRFPGVALVLQEATSVDIVDRVRSGELDVGFVRLPLLEAEQLDVEVVEQDHLVAAVATSHPLASRQTLALSALADEPFIIFPKSSVLHATIMMACHNAGFAPNVAQEAEQVHTIMSLVQSGLGVALVPARSTRYIPDEVKLLALQNPARIETGIVSRAGGASASARNFKELVVAKGDSC